MSDILSYNIKTFDFAKNFEQESRKACELIGLNA